MSPTRSRQRPPPRDAGPAGDASYEDDRSRGTASPADIRLDGLVPTTHSGDGMGAGGGGSPRGRIYGQSESAALRRIEAQMEVSRRERMQMTNEEYVTGFYVLSCLIQHAHTSLYSPTATWRNGLGRGCKCTSRRLGCEG